MKALTEKGVNSFDKSSLSFFSIILLLSLIFSFSLVSAEKFGYGKTEDVPINYSLIPTVNNSDCWDGICDTSYFYPASNPSNFISSYTESDPLAYNGTLAFNSSLANYRTLSNNSNLKEDLWSNCDPRYMPRGTMISYWKLDGNTNDSYGDNDGIITGNIVYNEGVVGEKGFFDGSDNITISDRDSLDLMGNFTIQFWMRKGSVLNQNATIIQKGDYKIDWRVFGVGAFADKFIVIYFNNTNLKSIKLNPSIDYHIAVSRNGTQINLYVNGKVVNSTSITNYLPNTNDPLIIGDRYDGQLDEIAFYNNNIEGINLNTNNILRQYSKSYNGNHYCSPDELFFRNTTEVYLASTDVLNVTLSNINSTQMNYSSSLLNIRTSWLTSFINSLSLTNYFTKTEILNFGYYNSTNAYTKSEVDTNITTAINSLDNSTIVRNNTSPTFQNVTANIQIRRIIDGTIYGECTNSTGWSFDGNISNGALCYA